MAEWYMPDWLARWPQRREEVRKKADELRREARLLRERTRQLVEQSAALRAGLRLSTPQGTADLPEPAVAASVA